MDVSAMCFLAQDIVGLPGHGEEWPALWPLAVRQAQSLILSPHQSSEVDTFFLGCGAQSASRCEQWSKAWEQGTRWCLGSMVDA